LPLSEGGIIDFLKKNIVQEYHYIRAPTFYLGDILKDTYKMDSSSYHFRKLPPVYGLASRANYLALIYIEAKRKSLTTKYGEIWAEGGTDDE